MVNLSVLFRTRKRSADANMPYSSPEEIRVDRSPNWIDRANSCGGSHVRHLAERAPISAAMEKKQKNPNHISSRAGSSPRSQTPFSRALLSCGRHAESPAKGPSDLAFSGESDNKTDMAAGIYRCLVSQRHRRLGRLRPHPGLRADHYRRRCRAADFTEDVPLLSKKRNEDRVGSA